MAPEAARARGARRRCSRPGCCGEGPSGRNGGFVNALWFSLPDDARALRRRARRVEVARAAQRLGRRDRALLRGAGGRRLVPPGRLPAGLDRARRGTTPGTPRSTPCRELGEPDACRPLDARTRCARAAPRRSSAAARFYPGAATVQPARLAHGPARAGDRDAGSRSTSARRCATVERRGGDVVAECESGTVTRRDGGARDRRARWSRLPRLRRRLTVTSSHMVITEPVPDVLERDRLDRRRVHHRLAGDDPLLPHHARRPDRLRLGRRPGRPRRPGQRPRRGRPRVVAAGRAPPASASSPGSRDAGSTSAWGGPIDVSPSHLPVVDELEPGVHCAFGYTGHGVGPSHMVGRSLASLALDRRDEASRLASSTRRTRSGSRPSRFRYRRRHDHPPRDPAQGDGARSAASGPGR